MLLALGRLAVPGAPVGAVHHVARRGVAVRGAVAGGEARGELRVAGAAAGAGVVVEVRRAVELDVAP